jgi:hypothetical protein
MREPSSVCRRLQVVRGINEYLIDDDVETASNFIHSAERHGRRVSRNVLMLCIPDETTSPSALQENKVGGFKVFFDEKADPGKAKSHYRNGSALAVIASCTVAVPQRGCWFVMVGCNLQGPQFK